MKGALMVTLEEPVMKEDVKDTHKGNKIKVLHQVMLFMWRRRTHLPELSEWRSSIIPDIGSRVWPTGNRSLEWKKSRKRNRLDSRKDLSHITCFRCEESGHYFSNCPNRKPRTQGGYVVIRKPRDLSEVVCFCCNEAGHFARDCSQGEGDLW